MSINFGAVWCVMCRHWVCPGRRSKGHSTAAASGPTRQGNADGARRRTGWRQGGHERSFRGDRHVSGWPMEGQSVPGGCQSVAGGVPARGQVVPWTARGDANDEMMVLGWPMKGQSVPGGCQSVAGGARGCQSGPR